MRYIDAATVSVSKITSNPEIPMKSRTLGSDTLDHKDSEKETRTPDLLFNSLKDVDASKTNMETCRGKQFVLGKTSSF